MKILKVIILSIFATYIGLARSAEHSLVLGIFPYVSPAKLIAHQKNIPTHFAGNTEIKLSLVTAKNSATFIDNLKEFEYDLIYSPPHIARYAEKAYGYRRVVMTSHQIMGLLLVRQDSPYHTIADLTDRTISIAPATTLLHQMTLKLLKDQGLIPGQNIQINIVNTHNNAIYDLLKQDSDAAVTGIKILKNMPTEKQALLRVLAQTEPVSGFIVMARPALKQSTIDQLQDAFLSFESSPLGASYLFKGFKLIDDEAMKALDSYARIFE